MQARSAFTMAAVLLMAWAFPAFAVVVPCDWGRSLEMHSTFLVSVTYRDKPVAGATIELYRSDENGTGSFLSGRTKADGTFRVARLRAADYWLSVRFHGIRAAGPDCMFVKKHASKQAVRQLSYSWGDSAIVTPKFVGKLIQRLDLREQWHPVANAALTLLNATTLSSYSATTDKDGGFEFGVVPNGTYVFEAKYDVGGTSESDHMVVEIDRNTHSRALTLLRRDSEDSGTYLACVVESESVWKPCQ